MTVHGNDDQRQPPGAAPTALPGPNLSHRRQTYHKVLDGRKHPIRGLWIRNGAYYARLNFTDPKTGAKETRRVRLDKAQTQAQAVAELRRLKTGREKGELASLRLCPKFNEYATSYLTAIETAGSKRPRTLATEKVHIKAWTTHLGETRLNLITKAMIRAFMEKRQAAGVSPRTVNLGIVVLRNVLNRAKEDEWLRQLPTEGISPLDWTPREKKLFSLEDIERLCAAAMGPHYAQGRLAKPGESGRPLKNAQQFVDYIRLMAFCGSRMSETLHLKWADIDWKLGQITIGSDGETKNGKSRTVDFNTRLEAHLKAMLERRAPDSDWLFPSPQRGPDKDLHSRTFRESLILARAVAGMPKFGFHDCRHFFCSYCVMSGIDYMTIAKWAGHSDKGILIADVYGHLADDHPRRMAKKVKFDTSS